MFRKKNRSKKRTRAMLSAYSIIMILIILLGILSHVLPKAQYIAAPLDETEASEEVGPGEWEGEMPEGGPAELKGEVPPEPADGEEVVLPEGESFEPAVGDEVNGENLPENREADGAVLAAGEEVSTETLTEAPSEEATEEEEVFESLEACEEVYGEEGCVIKDGSGVEGAELYQVLMAPILGFEDDTLEIKVDLPTLGIPTNPTSASSFNSTFIFLTSPGSPFSANAGAGFERVAKAILPRPPLPP